MLYILNWKYLFKGTFSLRVMEDKKKSYILSIYSSKSTVFTAKDLALLWRESDTDAVKRRVYRYVKSEKLYAIRKGIYARDKSYDRFELATKIYTPSYISMETVLSREGIIFQHYSQIFVASYLTRDITCDGQTYVFRKLKNSVLANLAGIEKRENYFIASKERAFLDMVYLHKNYNFDNLSSIDWEKCFAILSIYENKEMAKRLNFYHKYVES